MTHRWKFAVAAAVSALALAPQNASAQCPIGSTCYFGTDVTGGANTRATNVNSLAARDLFFASLLGVGTETFESSPGSILTFPGAGTATLSGGGDVAEQGAGTNGFGRYPSSGTHYYEASSSSAGGTTFRIDFAAPVAAFGFYGIDIGEFGSQLTLRFGMMGGGFLDWLLPYTATNGTNTLRDGSLLYAGFINASQFSYVEFRGTNSADSFAFDDMTIGSLAQVIDPPSTTVPEPSTVLLLASGLGATLLAARRRRA